MLLRLLYQIFLTIILIFSPLIIFYRILKNKEDKKRFIEKFSFFTQKRFSGKLVWFHGASVGEILSVIPLIKYYDKQKSVKQILVTSSTLSSSKVLKKFKFKKTIHQFYPIDHFFLTKKFLKYWKPNICIFIDSEIWPQMFTYINKSKIPLVLLNARLTKKTFNRWKKLKNFSEEVFNKITIAFPQNNETQIYLKKLNYKKTKFIGNLKFAENKIETNLNKKLNSKFKQKKIWVASSTHENEEIFCAKAHISLKKKIKNLVTVIIPRHVHRSDLIISDIKNLGLNVVSHTPKNQNFKDMDVYIVNTFGETNKFHKIASSVFLGGSIIKRGGQNPLEAARHGARIFHGPHTENFIDVYKKLKSLKISRKITSSKELATKITFKKNKNAGVKIKNIGEKILNKTIKELDILINDDFKKT